jgi:hypothetical protein
MVFPVVALSLYLMCCFNTLLEGAGGQLFPGKTQYKQFSDSLKQCLKDHEAEVITLGYNEKDIGTHSIRKGAASLVASLPGSPSAATICIQAGWTMVKSVISTFDTLELAICSLLLLLLSAIFAVLPPHFSNEVPNEWRADKRRSLWWY